MMKGTFLVQTVQQLQHLLAGVKKAMIIHQSFSLMYNTFYIEYLIKQTHTL